MPGEGPVFANGGLASDNKANDSRQSTDDATETREKTAEVQGTVPNCLPMTLLPAEANGSNASTATNKSHGSRRRGNTLPLFIANMSLLVVFYMVMSAYGGGVVRTLERRFEMRSSQTGLMQSANDVLHVCIVVFIGYFGRTGHKPRIICVTVLFSALAGFMMTIPHFFMSSTYDTVRYRLVNSNNASSLLSKTTNRFCLNWNSTGDAISGDQCDQLEESSLQTAVHPAYYVFLTAQFISGIGGSGLHTLSLAYIDENSPGSKSSLYIGIVSSMYAIGPIGGMVLAAMTLRLPENLLSPVKGSPSDPSWIGCWWLGYFICATGILATAIPLWFMPKSCSEKATITRKKEKIESAEGSNSADETTLSMASREIKEFPRRLLHLFRNKAYVVSLLSVVCGGYIICGIYSNIVRYIEIHFLERAYVGSLIAGLVAALAGAVGSFVGGLLMSRLKIRPRGAVKIIIFSEIVFITGIVVILLLRCPQLQMAAQVDHEEHSRFTVTTDCNKHCACSTSRKSYVPVCGSDNLTYFSACAAGCRSYVNGIYTECGCIGSGEGISSSALVAGEGGGGGRLKGGIGEGGWAQPGLCRPPCNLLIPFAATLFLITLIGCSARVPSTMVNFRIVDDDERAFALSVNSFVVNLLAFVPAPLLYGALIDSACILWQTTCKKTGGCLLFNTDRFRYVTYGVALVFQVIDFLLAIILFLFVRKMVFRVEDEDRKGKRLDGEAERRRKGEYAIEMIT